MNNQILLNEETLSVRWGDMDAFGHVNNIMYFRYFEQCRVNWLNKNGFDSAVSGVAEEGPVIVNASATFIKPIVYPANIIVRMFGSQPGKSSFVSSYEIIDAEQTDCLYCQGESKVVWVDQKAGKSTPLPNEIKSRLTIK